MKRRGGKVLAGVLALALALLAGGGYLWAQAPEPGTEADPLVTKSYVDDKWQTLWQALAPKDYVDQRLNQQLWQVVEVPKGKQLVAEAGTELVLRGGKATAVASQLGGVADLTGGKDLTTGQAVPPHHLLLIPRGDGRGLKAVTDCILLARGAFSLK